MPKGRQHAIFNALGLADKPEIAVAGEFARPDQTAILAAQADRTTAYRIDSADELLVDGAGENHLNDLHRLAVGDPQPIDKAAFDAEALQHLPDLRPAAMHDNWIDSYLLQQNDVAGKGIAVFAVAHRVAAVFDEDRLAGITVQIRQCLGEDGGLKGRIGSRRVHHGGRTLSCWAARCYRARGRLGM